MFEYYEVSIIDYHNVQFINVSLNTLGIFGNSCETFIDMLKELDFEFESKFKELEM